MTAQLSLIGARFQPNSSPPTLTTPSMLKTVRVGCFKHRTMSCKWCMRPRRLENPRLPLLSRQNLPKDSSEQSLTLSRGCLGGRLKKLQSHFKPLRKCVSVFVDLLRCEPIVHCVCFAELL